MKLNITDFSFFLFFLLLVPLQVIVNLISAGAVVRFLDINSGKLVGDVMRLPLEVVEILLNQLGTLTDQKLVFVDSNRDLFITPINVRCQPNSSRLS